MTAMRRSLLGAAVASALSLVLLISGCDRAGNSKPAFKGIDITGAEYARQLSMTDGDGQARNLAEFKGKVVLVFFGYTQCPDVCPTTMAELSEVKRNLGADGARVQGIFVSLDPDRDTGPLLKSYVENFGPDIIGLRGTAEQTKAAAREFKVFYNPVPGQTATSYTLDHTAGSYIFDAKGRIRLFTRYGGGAKALADDLKILLAEAPV